ncbi:MAG: transporter substrate-binding domain-containing protein [Acidobacteriota bacterium]
MFKNVSGIIIAAFLVVLGTVGSATAQDVAGKKSPLRVGITPNYPPMIFKLNDKITGVDADLARRLGRELNRPVQFVELKWDQQIGALLEGEIDIIMSAMTITDARKVRINFTDPYLKSGLVTAIRAEDASKYTSAKSILSGYPAVGVIKGTTGEAFVRQNMSASPRIATFSEVGDAPSELRSRRIDVFIHDAPAVVWLVSENEADIRGVWDLLKEEDLGWGVRKGDDDFLKQVNSILQRWKQDGTLDEILRNWLPAKYLERFK